MEYADEQITVYPPPCRYSCVYCYWRTPLMRARAKMIKPRPIEEARRYARMRKPRRIVISFVCVPPDTLVPTPSGLKPIREVRVGEEVYSLGGVSTVTRVMRRWYSGPIVKVKPEYLPPVYFTPEHPILVVRQRGMIKSREGWERLKKEKPKWVPAGAIRIRRDTHLNPIERYFVLIPRSVFGEERRISIDFSKYTKSRRAFKIALRKNEKYREFLQRGELTEELAWLLGLFVADGMISSTALCFALNERKDRDVVKRIERIAEGMGLSCEVSDYGNYIRVHIPSRILMRFFEEAVYCERSRGGKPRRKRVPPFLFHAKRGVVEAFLKGYMAGDGCEWEHASRGGRYLEATSVDPELLRQIQLLAFKVGWYATLYGSKRESKLGGKPILYHLRMRKDRRLRRFALSEDYLLLPIRRIEKTWYEGYVYNLETNASNYTVPFVVHNCDPYPPEEARKGLTRRVLEILSKAPQHRIMILTKNPRLALRDLDLMHIHGDMWLGTTVTTLRHAEVLEPRAPPPRSRLEALREAHEEGVRTWLSVEPIIPPFTDLAEIIRETRGYVDLYVLGAFNYARQLGFPEPSAEEYFKVIRPALPLLSNVKFIVKRELRSKLDL